MASVTYPGVYIQELDSGVRTITSVATSIAAFVGRALRGPIEEPTVINNYGDFESKFGGLWVDEALGYAVKDFYQNGGGQAIIVRLAGSNSSSAEIAVTTSDANLDIVAANDGAWGDNLTVSINYNTKDASDTKLFSMEVEDTDTGVVETFQNVSIDSTDSRYLPLVLEQSSNLARVKTDGSGNPVMPASRPLEDSSPTTPYAVTTTGSDGDPLVVGDFNSGDATTKTGIYALEDADLFNLLCIPPFAGANVPSTLWDDAASYCEQKRAFLIIDAPSSWTSTSTAVAGISSLGGSYSNHAAVFFPRIKKADPLKDNQLNTFVPCGTIAGVMARTDGQRGVWKAPAGQDATLLGVSELSVPLTDAENGQLNPLGINCLRSFPVVGRVNWGARTLDGDDRRASEWKYIPVRRLALMIEESLFRGTQWIVFEGNDEKLWSQIRLNLGAYMQGLFRQGAFQGSSPSDAYFVKCDSETTTQNDIDQGIVNIVVGFAPLKPAEFVVISIQQIAGQLEV